MGFGFMEIFRWPLLIEQFRFNTLIHVFGMTVSMILTSFIATFKWFLLGQLPSEKGDHEIQLLTRDYVLYLRMQVPYLDLA